MLCTGTDGDVEVYTIYDIITIVGSFVGKFRVHHLSKMSKQNQTVCRHTDKAVRTPNK